jgi:hypothetical protein
MKTEQGIKEKKHFRFSKIINQHNGFFFTEKLPRQFLKKNISTRSFVSKHCLLKNENVLQKYGQLLSEQTQRKKKKKKKGGRK